MRVEEKIRELMNNIDEIQECIEYSNFELMHRYLQLFLVSYSKALMDIVLLQKANGDETSATYWTEVTPKLIEVVKKDDAFGIMNILYFDVLHKLEDLVNNKTNDQ